MRFRPGATVGVAFAILLAACGGSGDADQPSRDLGAQPTSADVSGSAPVGPEVTSEVTPEIVAGGALIDEVVVAAPVPEPTSVVPLADGSLLVADRGGVIVQVPDDGPIAIVADLSEQVLSSGLRGLLGLAVHPAFPDVPEAYVIYTADRGVGDDCTDPCVAPGVLARLDWDGATFSETVLLEGWCQIFSSHSPDDVAVLDDGTVLATAGDGAISGFDDPSCPEPAGMGGSMRAQDVFVPGDPVDYVGAVIRVDRTGAPVLGTTADDRVVAAGFRNPFRITVDRTSGRVFVADAGDFRIESVDEVDPSGLRNHGWPCFEGDLFGPGGSTPWCQGLPYEATVPATVTYDNDAIDVSADDAGRCAPSADLGTTVSVVATAPGTLVGEADPAPVLVFGDFGRRCLWWARLSPGGVGPSHLLAAGVPGPIDLELGPDGALYYVAYETAEIRRLTLAG